MRNINLQFRNIKGTVHEIFDQFFCLKDSTWALHEHATRFRKLFRFCDDTRETCVRVIFDYADTTKTMRTLLENLEGFSPILKEQSGEKGTWVCLHIQ